jgi:hypothetical protein
MEDVRFVVLDLETCSTDPANGVIATAALCRASMFRMISEEPYTFDELVGDSEFIKFDINSQVNNLGMEIDPGTMEWWKDKPIEVQKASLAPSEDDVCVSHLVRLFEDVDWKKGRTYFYSRGNTFDPIFLNSICKRLEVEEPYPFWAVRDFRTLIDGLSMWQVDDKFIPPGLEDSFKAHDPRHDVAMDLMRVQTLVREVVYEGKEENSI